MVSAHVVVWLTVLAALLVGSAALFDFWPQNPWPKPTSLAGIAAVLGIIGGFSLALLSLRAVAGTISKEYQHWLVMA